MQNKLVESRNPRHNCSQLLSPQAATARRGWQPPTHHPVVVWRPKQSHGSLSRNFQNSGTAGSWQAGPCNPASIMCRLLDDFRSKQQCGPVLSKRLTSPVPAFVGDTGLDAASTSGGMGCVSNTRDGGGYARNCTGHSDAEDASFCCLRRLEVCRTVFGAEVSGDTEGVRPVRDDTDCKGKTRNDDQERKRADL